MNRVSVKGVPQAYSEVLRAIGAYVDRVNLSEVRVLETEDGIILQGRLAEGERMGQRETYQLTVEDIAVLLIDSQAQRGHKIP
ncbi:MAG: hypothetical protein ACM3S0_16450 [Acidobacteriota bacterium]